MAGKPVLLSNNGVFVRKMGFVITRPQGIGRTGVSPAALFSLIIKDIMNSRMVNIFTKRFGGFAAILMLCVFMAVIAAWDVAGSENPSGTPGVEPAAPRPEFPFKIYILLYEGVEQEPVDRLIPRLEQTLGLPVEVLEQRPAVNPALLDPDRAQYPAMAVLDEAIVHAPENSARLLAFFPEDMYIGRTEFVFGLADPGSRGAVISQKRLLSGEKNRQSERLYKVALHELGHTFGLEHCLPPSQCVMNVARTIQALDAKPAEYEPSCKARLEKAVRTLKAELLAEDQDGEAKENEAAK